jgi:hypothetical protein
MAIIAGRPEIGRHAGRRAHGSGKIRFDRGIYARGIEGLQRCQKHHGGRGAQDQFFLHPFQKLDCAATLSASALSAAAAWIKPAG